MARALCAGLGAGTYLVRFRDRNGATGKVEITAYSAVDLEYQWYEFAAVHGFDAGSIYEIEGGASK